MTQSESGNEVALTLRDEAGQLSFLRALVSTIPDLIWLKAQNGSYLACNAMFERFFGATEAEIVGKTDFDFIDKELAESFRENDRKAMLAGGPSTNEEWVVFADDGHRALLQTIKTPMLDSGGRLIGVLGIARDITSYHESQTQLAAQIEELRRWQDATLGREMRILELKREVNGLLAELGRPPNYESPGFERSELRGAENDMGSDAV